jgi:hypothetical protein
MKNSAQFEEEDVLGQMMIDGFGPDEVLDHAQEYAIAITGNASPTSVEKVRRIARRILRRALNEN